MCQITEIKTNKSILILFGLILFFNIYSQQIIHQSQYMFNHFNINPAVAGNTDDLPISFTYRKLWAWITGSPSLQTLSGHIEVYENMGVGAKIYNSTAGPERRTGFEGAYSYHLSLNNINSRLAFGLSIQLYQYFLDKNSFTVRHQDDEVFMGAEKMLVPDGSFGTYFYSKNYYVGLSVPQLLQRNIKLKSDVLEQKRVRHYFLHGGYLFNINEGLKIEPSLLLILIEIGVFQADIITLLTYKDMISFGLSFRTSDALIFMFG